MALIASLVVGANMATAAGGSSQKLSTPPDRARFLALHRSARAIITGKQSAASEDYSLTEVPIFILSRSPEPLHLPSPHMQQIFIDDNLREVIQEIKLEIEGDIVVEAGPQLLRALVDCGLVEILQLSLSPIDGDEHFIDVDTLLKDFSIENDETLDGTRLLQCRYRRDSANS
jgi:riboflavin biosynthesis pyrimidine reductase